MLSNTSLDTLFCGLIHYAHLIMASFIMLLQPGLVRFSPTHKPSLLQSDISPPFSISNSFLDGRIL